MDATSEARLGEVLPLLADKVRHLYELLSNEGIVVRVTQGLRSWTQQDMLYAQGRTLPGKIVTNAPGGYSWHNFGCGADLCPSSQPDGQPFSPDWNIAHPAWQRIVNIAVSLGLDSGATWRTFKDYPHVQLTGRFPEGAPDDEVRQLWRDGGTSAVWDEVMASLT